ncbi:N-glycosylation protein-domain-containing protein [Pholiota molesta]|nr:N-glycosylation protein-domain-containing protein [Pholiota molesta]
MAIAALQGPPRAADTPKPHAFKLAALRQSYNEPVNFVNVNKGHTVIVTAILADPGDPLKANTLPAHTRVSSSLSASSSALSPLPPPTRRPTRIRSSSNEFASSAKVAFIPAATGYPSTSTRRSKNSFLTKKLTSASDIIDLHPSPPPYSPRPDPGIPTPFFPSTSPPMPINSDTEDDRDDDDMLYTAQLGSTSRATRNSAQSLRSRIFGLASVHASATRMRDKPISTTPGALCAGETETETDEPSRHLPTARIVASSGPIVPPTTLAQQLTPLLFEFARLLSIVPAVFGTLYNLYHIYNPPPYTVIPNTRPPPQRIDYFISALWAILTGYQCLALATGLLTRWRLYYPPLSTLVRLLALQSICWPATHLTLTVLGHGTRPAATWAVIGTTTCMSRSVQIWVTSNLWWERARESSRDDHHAHRGPKPARVLEAVGRGGKWGGRRWDWREVGVKCVLPAGVVYFVMAWAEQLRREWEVFPAPAAGVC